MTRAEVAMGLFKEGYNCAQAVACAYADLLNMQQQDIARMVSGFGGGFGRMREVCGAVSGMVFVLNVLQGSDDPKDGAEKSAHYARVQQLCKAYEAENGSIVCRVLLGLDHKADGPEAEARTEAYYKKRPCVELVGCAAQILEQYLTAEGLL